MTKQPAPTAQLLRWFTYNHLPPAIQHVPQACAALAEHMVEVLDSDPSPDTIDQLDAGLRKLIEAKDCFTRALLARTGTP